MFRALVLQTLYTLSDDQAEYQLRDRLSFMRFVGLTLADPVPDAKTIWLFREELVRAGAFERLFGGGGTGQRDLRDPFNKPLHRYIPSTRITSPLP